MKNISQTEFEAEVISFSGVVLVDFYADWCGPCRMLSPMLESMSIANKDSNVKFVKVNVDQNQALSGAFQIRSIPTVVLFKNGKKLQEMVGVASEEAYRSAIQSTLK
jgi:thioredoxin 1